MRMWFLLGIGRPRVQPPGVRTVSGRRRADPTRGGGRVTLRDVIASKASQPKMIRASTRTSSPTTPIRRQFGRERAAGAAPRGLRTSTIRPPMRIWVDLTNTAHVLVLRPLVEMLEHDHEVTLTARPLSHTIELLDQWGHPYTPLGPHGGAGRLGKARAAAARTPQMLRFGRERGFGCAFAHGSTDLPPAARALRFPTRRCSTTSGRRSSTASTVASRREFWRPTRSPPNGSPATGRSRPSSSPTPASRRSTTCTEFEPDPSVLDGPGIDPADELCVSGPPPRTLSIWAGRRTRSCPACWRAWPKPGTSAPSSWRERRAGERD